MLQVPLNDAQLTLLRLFSREMSPEEFHSLRKVLMEFYEEELQKELDHVIAEKKLSTDDFQERLNLQHRTRS